MNATSSRPKLLLITNLNYGTPHSAIDGIFGHHLAAHFDIQLVYLDRDCKQSRVVDNCVILPYRQRRHGLRHALQQHTALQEIDVVIVRNYFETLRQMLQCRRHFPWLLGFWESFPHSYRRIHEAKVTRKAVWRKTMQYLMKTRSENRLISSCDFFLPISPAFHQVFRPHYRGPCHPVTMGIDFESLPSTQAVRNSQPRFVYIGSVDQLRQVDTIVDAFVELPDAFELDLYTGSNNSIVRRLKRMRDPRIRVLPKIPRQQVLSTLPSYDVGIAYIPNNRLYQVSSPTKTFEYYAMGIPALLNPLPEHQAVFDSQSAFFSQFTKDAIQATLRVVFQTSAEQRAAMAQRGKKRVQAMRNYARISVDLADFLTQL